MSPAPSKLTAVVNGTTVSLAWPTLKSPQGAVVTRDGTFLVATDPGKTAYVDANVPAGSHVYDVAAISDRTATASATVAGPPPSLPGPIMALAASTSSPLTLSWGNGPQTDGVNIYDTDGITKVFTGGYPNPAPTSWVVSGVADGPHTLEVCGYNAHGEGPRSSITVTVGTGPPPPPPSGIIMGAYCDSHPSGSDAPVNLANLNAFLNTLTPAGKKVNLTAITTYGGTNFTPLNGQTPLPGTKILLSLGLGDGSNYSAGGKTLLAQCQSLASGYTATFQKCLAMVGSGNTIVRIGYEWNGNWSSSGSYPNSGVGPFVLYPPQDSHDAIAFVSGLLKAVDPKALADFNIMGDGPDGLLDQFKQPVINRCPMSAIDIISADTQVKEWGIAHAKAIIALAQANGKHWAIPEVPPSPNDGGFETVDITAMANLLMGRTAHDRGNNVDYTPFEPPLYWSWFASDDGGGHADFQDSAMLPWAKLWASLIAS
jgi:hypothetical protein